jgi:hypothetical protein
VVGEMLPVIDAVVVELYAPSPLVVSTGKLPLNEFEV